MNQKTIFITISRGSIAKNILRTAVFDRLKLAGIKIVILSPAYEAADFKSDFGGKNIFFEPLYEHQWSRLDYFFVGLHKALVYNESTVLRDKYGILDKSETSTWRRISKKIFFIPLSHWGGLKEFVRWLDKILLPGHKYDSLFLKYKPDLVFSTNPIEDADSYVLKAAKKFGVRTVGMPKSWDNLPKMSFRVKTGHTILWGQALVDQVRRYQHVKRSDISIVGVPQFDIYATNQSRREDFFKKIGVDPSRQLLVFGSNSKYTPFDAEIAEMILGWITKGELAKDCVLFIRPYFAARGEEKKFDQFIGQPNVVIDHWFKHNVNFRDSWDYSNEHLIHFADLMRHMSIMINYPSTLTLDAAAVDKPIINLAFDGKTKRSYGESIARWYDSSHFKEVMARDGSEVVDSPKELKAAINAYLTNPKLKSEGRVRLRTDFCYIIDGQSANRLADCLLGLL